MALRPTTIEVNAQLANKHSFITLETINGVKVVYIRGVRYVWNRANQRGIVIHLIYEMIQDCFDLQNLKATIRYFLENELHKMGRNSKKVIGKQGA